MIQTSKIQTQILRTTLDHICAPFVRRKVFGYALGLKHHYVSPSLQMRSCFLHRFINTLALAYILLCECLHQPLCINEISGFAIMPLLLTCLIISTLSYKGIEASPLEISTTSNPNDLHSSKYLSTARTLDYYTLDKASGRNIDIMVMAYLEYPLHDVDKKQRMTLQQI